MQISRKRFEIEAWYQVPTNMKWPIADQMMTPVSLKPIISIMARDRNSVTIGHLQEMAHAVSNGYVTNDVTWPKKVKVVTSL